ncbi:MAG: deoxyribose-phosphate aldolase [Clostridia bacterium]|nr:deoxyribose-phosphate aldolase [Clostridia bacterium]
MAITLRDIAKMLDHSTLQPFLTEDDIRRGCDVALQYDTATVCARPGDMPIVVKALAGSDVKPCTVIGFPHGAHHTDVKVYEANRALDDGCVELDMVLNIGKMLSGDTAYVQDEIAALAQAAHARNALLKVILETCYLSDEQKKIACALSEQAGADFVKTSTGYGSAGAKVEDVALMRAAVSDKVRVKASGGIRTLDMVLACRLAGASRCGVSATAKIMEEAKERLAKGILTEKPLAEIEKNAGGAY